MSTDDLQRLLALERDNAAIEAGAVAVKGDPPT